MVLVLSLGPASDHSEPKEESDDDGLHEDDGPGNKNSLFHHRRLVRMLRAEQDTPRAAQDSVNA
jgi:hypothetical protein